MNRKLFISFASVALLWAVGNSLYVYLILGGTRTFRVESAVFLLVAALLPLIWWSPSGPEHPAALTESESWGLGLLAAGLWLVALAPFVTLPFLSDDYVFLASYRRVSDVANARQFFRPMFAFVFLLLAKVGGGVPLPFHLVGLLIHATSAWFVYVLARRLFRRTDAAVFCFAVFLLNPLQAEAVLWASGLQELLWAGFLLAAMVVYTGAQSLTGMRLGITLLLVTCSLLSKETATSFVLLLPLADLAFFRMRRGPLLPAAYLGFVVTLTGYLLLRGRVASIEAEFYRTPTRYFVQKFLSTPYSFFVQPWNVAAADIPPIVPCCATVVALSALFWGVLRGTGRTALLGPAVILVSTLPVYAYFYVAPDLRATRYLYFASVGWALLTAQTVKSILVRRFSFAACLAAIILVSFVWLHVNLKPWRTAGEIVDAVRKGILSGNSVETSSAELQRRYGDGLEVKDGLPVTYRGVYLFLNGYPELRGMLTTDDSR